MASPGIGFSPGRHGQAVPRERCCGSAVLYDLVQRQVSTPLLATRSLHCTYLLSVVRGLTNSWFATLTGLPPYLTTGTFDVQFSRPFPTPLDPSPPPPQRPTAAGGSIEGDGTSTSEGREYHRGIDAHPFLVQLTLFENELATLMHVPDTQISIDVVLDLERKWGDWMVVFRDDQLKGEKPMHHAFSMIRFHW